MLNKWKRQLLGDALTFKNGKKYKDKSTRGVNNIFGSNGIIGKTDASNSDGKCIIIGRVGSFCGSVYYSDNKCWVTDNAILAIVTHDNSTKFFFYLLKYLNLNRLKSGSGQPLINQSILSSIMVKIPEPRVQQQIADVLSTLEVKIQLLQEMNQTLESIAQALFKSWFVDFDPVRAKAEGREPDGLDPEIAALFPDEFEESELGLIPRGWHVVKVKEIIELAYGKALTADDRRLGTIPVYGSGGIIGYHDKSLVNGPSIIVGRKGTVGSLYWEDLPFFPIDTVYFVKSNEPLSYCYYLLQTLGLRGMNTDGAVPGLNRENVYRLAIIKPQEKIQLKFHTTASVIRNIIHTNIVSIEKLISMRGNLLPRLISGRLKVAQVAKFDCDEGI